jgi:hypothetical protein
MASLLTFFLITYILMLSCHFASISRMYNCTPFRKFICSHTSKHFVSVLSTFKNFILSFFLSFFLSYSGVQLKHCIHIKYAVNFDSPSFAVRPIHMTSLLYEGVSKSFRTDRLERELQIAKLFVTRCSCVTIL